MGATEDMSALDWLAALVLIGAAAVLVGYHVRFSREAHLGARYIEACGGRAAAARHLDEIDKATDELLAGGLSIHAFTRGNTMAILDTPKTGDVQARPVTPAEAEELAQFLDNYTARGADRYPEDVFYLRRAATLLRRAYPEQQTEFFCGVKSGVPIVQEVSDNHGEVRELKLFPDPVDASARWHNVRRVRIFVYPEPVRAPENWGALDD